MKSNRLPFGIMLIVLVIGAIGYFLFMKVFIPNFMGEYNKIHKHLEKSYFREELMKRKD